LGFDFAIGPYAQHSGVVHRLSSGLGTWSIRSGTAQTLFGTELTVCSQPLTLGNSHHQEKCGSDEQSPDLLHLDLSLVKFVVRGVSRQFHAITVGVKPVTDSYHFPANGLYDRVIPPRLSFNGLGCFGS
jgi:hypothetical protein